MPPITTYTPRSGGPQTFNDPLPIGRHIMTGGVDWTANSTPVLVDVHANMLITGPAGAGATNLARVVAFRLLECDDVIVWVYDPATDREPIVQGVDGAALFDWYGPTEANLGRVLHDAKRAIAARTNAYGSTAFRVSRETPAIVLVVGAVEYGLAGIRTTRQDALLQLLNWVATFGPNVGVYVVRENRIAATKMMSGSELARYGCRVALHPDRPATAYMFSASGVSSAAVAYLDGPYLQPGSGLYTNRLSDSADPFVVDFLDRPLAENVNFTCRVDQPTLDAIGDPECSIRWAAARLADGTFDMDAFLMREIDQARAVGQTALALAEALAGRRSDEPDDVEVFHWIDEQVLAGTVVEHSDRRGWYITKRHAVPSAAPVLARFDLPAGTNLGVLGELLKALAGVQALTVADIIFDPARSDGGELKFTVCQAAKTDDSPE